MISLEVFQEQAIAAAWNLGSRSAISLTSDKDGLAVRSGPLASRIARFRTAENRAVTKDFLESLRSRFGDEVSREAFENGSSSSRQSGRTPLRARKVLQVIDRASEVERKFDAGNLEVSQRYCRPEGEGRASDTLHLLMVRQARERFQSLPDPVRLLNPDRIARMARDEIAAAGREGAHRVAADEAASIVVAVIERELEARVLAFERLDAGRSNSIAAEALAEVARGKPPLELDPARLTSNAVNLLNRRFREALESGRIPEERLSDTATLRTLALEMAEEFVRERTSAIEAIGDLPVDLRENPVLAGCVAHDDISPELVSTTVGAYRTVRRELVALGGNLQGAKLEGAMASLRNAILRALMEAEIPNAGGNQDAMRSCWGLLLAAAGERRAGAIAERIAGTDGRVRAVAAGVNWFLEDFLPSEEGQRFSSEPHPERDGMPICGIDDYAQALTLSKVMNALAEAVRETDGASEGQCGFGKKSADELQDADILSIRHLDVPFPAPYRDGTTGRHVRLPRSTLAQVQNNVARQVDRMGGHDSIDGVVEDSYMQFNRASLNIDGIWAASDRHSMAEGLRSLFLDSNGLLNAQMLRTVSMLTNEETLKSAHSACFDAGRPELAVFRGRPVLTMNETTFELEDAGDGNVYLDVSATGYVRQLEFDHASGSVRGVLMDEKRSSVDTVVRIFLDARTREPEVEYVDISYSLSRWGSAPDSHGHEISPPVQAGDSAGARLPANFDRAGAISRLDQEMALQREGIRAFGALDPDSPHRQRVDAELGARQLSRREFAAGRDPRPALRSRIAEMTERYGAGDPRTSAYKDTLRYFENSGTFAPARAASDNSLTAVDRSRLLSEWRERMFGMQEVVSGRRPRSSSQIERGQLLADAESYIQQAILAVSSRRDPVPELLRHAADLEARRLSDGETAAAEATILRTMAREYVELP